MEAMQHLNILFNRLDSFIPGWSSKVNEIRISNGCIIIHDPEYNLVGLNFPNIEPPKLTDTTKGYIYYRQLEDYYQTMKEHRSKIVLEYWRLAEGITKTFGYRVSVLKETACSLEIEYIL